MGGSLLYLPARFKSAAFSDGLKAAQRGRLKKRLRTAAAAFQTAPMRLGYNAPLVFPQRSVPKK